MCNGWLLLQWAGFGDRWAELVATVQRLKAADPVAYRSHPAAKLLATVYELVTKTIPADPSHPSFRLGKTMGEDATFWRRAKFNRRYRLFFRYKSSDQKAILYAWLNDDRTLRQAGARSDPYAVFRRMIESGAPPSSWNELRTACRPFPGRPLTDEVPES